MLAGDRSQEVGAKQKIKFTKKSHHITHVHNLHIL